MRQGIIELAIVEFNTGNHLMTLVAPHTWFDQETQATCNAACEAFGEQEKHMLV